MSDSRLEKFIYAICSMDVTDLPVPLSRIEKLWNCLITGETPDFEPLSRNEKYLMAMLNRYDISNLPAPMSRGEKLLYKITVGETDLSDVPGYLSRYEELLKYLIENGGIGFEYVLHTLNQSLSTLYNTAEKPVKSAILKGNTLVNLLNDDNIEQRQASNTSSICGYDKETRTFHFITNLSHPFNYSYISTYGLDKKGVVKYFKNDTDYTIMWYGEKIRDDDDSQTIIRIGASENAYGNPGIYLKDANIKTGKMLYRTQTSYADSVIHPLGIKIVNTNNDIEYKLRFVILEGDYTNVDIPYFEGMQSVKMPVLTTIGKNLLNPSWKKQYGKFYPFKLKKGTTLTLSTKDSIPSLGGNLLFTTVSGREKWFPMDKGITKNTIILDEDVYQVNNILSGDIEYQLEIGSVATSYEPYKTNILTVNEPVELRGIGEVQDTLDCLTGELTERIGEIVLDGSEDWVFQTKPTDVRNAIYRLSISDIPTSISNAKTNCISDKAKCSSWPDILNTKADKTFAILQNQQLRVQFNGTVEELKEWLKETTPTVKYIKEKVVKTVDLTTVNQDGQPTKLKTFNDTTHVEIKADNLIPTVDVEVATKINETLSTMGLEHHDISETQNKLSQTIDEQTENTDATMMATTEIYENL